MNWKYRGGNARVKGDNTKHDVEYWANEDQGKIVHVWQNNLHGRAHVMEWNYEDELEDADGALNKLRKHLGSGKKITRTAGMGTGTSKLRIENSEIPRDSNVFDVAVERAREMYGLPRVQ